MIIRKNKYCPICKKVLPIENFYNNRNRYDLHTGYCKNCIKLKRPDTTIYSLNYRRKIRKIVLSHYGDRCECCGEKNKEFLTIDHVDGGGNIHRRKINRHGVKFYAWLIHNNFPDNPKLQILCWNCNLSMGIYKYCPHKKL